MAAIPVYPFCWSKSAKYDVTLTSLTADLIWPGSYFFDTRCEIVGRRGMASFKAKFPVLQELFAKKHRGAFGPPPSGAGVKPFHAGTRHFAIFECTRPQGGWCDSPHSRLASYWANCLYFTLEHTCGNRVSQFAGPNVVITSEAEGRASSTENKGKSWVWAAGPPVTLLRGLYLWNRKPDWQAVFFGGYPHPFYRVWNQCRIMPVPTVARGSCYLGDVTNVPPAVFR